MNSNDPTSPATAVTEPNQQFTADEIGAQRTETLHGEPRVPEIRELPRTERTPQPSLTAGATPTESMLATIERAEEIAGATAAPPAAVLPILLKRAVSGRYVALTTAWRLELRVDVDGMRPTQRVSGDFYQTTGSTVSYFGSFVANAITLTVTPSLVTITGVATTTWATPFNRLTVKIPRVLLLNPPAAATLQWSNAAGSPGATYIGAYASRYFRSVSLEQDCEAGITPFVSYNTGSLPSGGAARTLSVATAYAENGIEIATAGIPNVLGAAPGGSWDDAELHNAMVTNFSLWQDTPQWKVWLFHASRYINQNVLGIMFDQHGKQRQGCATFYKHWMMDGTTAAHLRTQLFCCVHELGHCFNLFHSFAKQYMTPPLQDRPGALSWMNYPDKYQPTSGIGGAAAFWAAFPFQFDELELIHLRHAFRNNVIMGGSPFGSGAALETLGDFEDPVEDYSGLKLELRSARAFRFGEPVVVEIKLSSTRGDTMQVHSHLHPDETFVRIAIQKPSGAVVVHEPVLEKCVSVQTTRLTPSRPSLYDSAYIGFGKDGLVFDQPGTYRVRALYSALDGSRVVSNALELKVRSPLSEQDEQVADLLMGDEQGTLFYLLGSDSEHLLSGNVALQQVAEQHAQHPLAVYANLVAGRAVARPFKNVTTDRKITVRKADPKLAARRLAPVIEASKQGRGVDNITLRQTMCELARSFKAAGDTKAAEETIRNMVDIFRAKGLKPHVLAAIQAQGEEALTKTD
jgi:hypothetical protein